MGLFRAPAWMMKVGLGGGGGGGGLNPTAAEDKIPDISGFGTGMTLHLPHSSYGGKTTIINTDNNYYYHYTRPIPHSDLFEWVRGNKVENKE